MAQKSQAEKKQAKSEQAQQAQTSTETVVEDQHVDDLESLQRELDESQKKAEDNWDKALRATAELENVKRRAEKDVAGAHKYALEKFAKELLPVIDSLEKAQEIEADAEHIKAMQEGVELTHKLFLDTVKKFAIEQIDPVDDAFNPELHEALSMVPHPEAKSQTVIEVFQKGYSLNGRVIRAAKVVVAQ